MDNKQMTMETKTTTVELSKFDNGGEVAEYHLTIHVKDTSLDYAEQMEAVLNTYNNIRKDKLNGAVAVFKRFYLSDAANQSDLLNDALGKSPECAVSIIQQPPLDGTKIALWAYLQTGVETKCTDSGLYETRHGNYSHLWCGSATAEGSDSEQQAAVLLNDYVKQLNAEGCNLETNCIRTWFFVNDIDLNYKGMVRARNQVFTTQGLTTDTHFIASTGIGGRQARPETLVQMDAYAVSGIAKEQIRFLYAPTHLNRTSEYGVSFERGTAVDYADRRHVFISGTASINNRGEVVHTGNIKKQAERMLENVAKLLEEAQCTFDDVAQMTVYLRDTADYDVVKQLFSLRFSGKPCVIVFAPVCRPKWLIEMECSAVRKTRSPQFAPF